MPIQAYQPIENIWVYLFVVGALISLATYTWQFRQMPGAKPQAFGQVCKGVWLLFLVLANVSTELPDKMLWIKLQSMAIALSPYFWFAFVLEISNQEKFIPAIIGRASLVVIGCLWVGIVFDLRDGLFYNNADLVLRLNSYLLCVITVALSVRWVIISVGLRRRQALWFTISGLFSLISILLNAVPGVQKFAPLPLGFLLAGLLITWGFYRWHVYNILTLAEKTAVLNMIDGLMVVDEEGYIVDMNPAAQRIFIGIPAMVGGKFEEVAAAWPVLNEIGDSPSLETLEATRDFSNECRFYQIRVILLKTTQGHMLGKTIIIKDITEQKRAHTKMVEQQKALSIMAERERLGRELHDGDGQSWSYINMQVEAARSMLDKKELVQADVLLKKLARVTQEMHVNIRESITGLQRSAVVEQGVWQTLEEYIQWFKQNYGIDTTLLISNEFAKGILLPTTEVQLLRIIQEALTNIRKYAGARLVKVIIRVNGSLADIRVEDDGCGFDLAVAAEKKGSFGLKIMQERAAEIGAEFHIQSKPGAGTNVILQVPLTAGVS